jgi:hypothetical protein
MEVIKILPVDKKSQGDFVLINKCDFDPKIHTKFTNKKPAKQIKPKKTVKQEVK